VTLLQLGSDSHICFKMYRTTCSFQRFTQLTKCRKIFNDESSANILSIQSSFITRKSIFHKEFHQSSFLLNEKRPSFFGNILNNIKQEYSKNQKLQESLKKFREDAKKYEESKELRHARKKFDTIEGIGN